jgi:hypothetical protein
MLRTVLDPLTYIRLLFGDGTDVGNREMASNAVPADQIMRSPIWPHWYWVSIASSLEGEKNNRLPRILIL